MNKLLAVNTEDFDCKLEAGLTRKQLNQELRDTGLWFPIDPGGIDVRILKKINVFDFSIFILFLKLMLVWEACQPQVHRVQMQFVMEQ